MILKKLKILWIRWQVHLFKSYLEMMGIIKSADERKQEAKKKESIKKRKRGRILDLKNN